MIRTNFGAFSLGVACGFVLMLLTAFIMAIILGTQLQDALPQDSSCPKGYEAYFRPGPLSQHWHWFNSGDVRCFRVIDGYPPASPDS